MSPQRGASMRIYAFTFRGKKLAKPHKHLYQGPTDVAAIGPQFPFTGKMVVIKPAQTSV
jgi:hypothetical protein